jgi:hypothetical protein
MLYTFLIIKFLKLEVIYIVKKFDQCKGADKCWVFSWNYVNTTNTFVTKYACKGLQIEICYLSGTDILYVEYSEAKSWLGIKTIRRWSSG